MLGVPGPRRPALALSNQPGGKGVTRATSQLYKHLSCSHRPHSCECPGDRETGTNPVRVKELCLTGTLASGAAWDPPGSENDGPVSWGALG